MNLDDEFELEHFLFKERQCRTCLRKLDLLEHFYKTRPDRGSNPSAYSYECKTCTVQRITKKRKIAFKSNEIYPDW